MAFHTQSCGECSLCCTLLGVSSIDKPPNQHCPHCPTGKGGCQIYDRQPKQCEGFECGFLTAPLAVKFRPDNIHFIITGEDRKLRCQFIDVDPKFPHATETPNGRFLIGMMRAGGYRDIVVTMGGARRVISDSPARAAILMHELEKRQRAQPTSG